MPGELLRAACDGTMMVAVARPEEDVGVAPPGSEGAFAAAAGEPTTESAGCAAAVGGALGNDAEIADFRRKYSGDFRLDYAQDV